MEELWRVVRSLAAAAREAGVQVVTGDTKVVERGKGDGIYINTSGIGVIPPGIEISPERARPGDLLLISGPIAQHGIAIMSVREGLAFETTIDSDSAPLHDLVAGVLARPASRSCPARPHARRPGQHAQRDRGTGGGRHPAE